MLPFFIGGVRLISQRHFGFCEFWDESPDGDLGADISIWSRGQRDGAETFRPIVSAVGLFRQRAVIFFS